MEATTIYMINKLFNPINPPTFYLDQCNAREDPSPPPQPTHPKDAVKTFKLMTICNYLADLKHEAIGSIELGCPRALRKTKEALLLVV